MTKTILALACLLIATSAINLSHEKKQIGLDSIKGIVNIKGSNGKYLSSADGFDNYISKYTVPAAVSEKDPKKKWAQWKVEKFEDKLAFKSVSTGKYLSKCNKCWQGVTNQKWDVSAFVQVDNPKWALWIPTKTADGKWNLKADGDDGQYLNLCNECIQGSTFEDYAFVQVDNPKQKSLFGIASWEITKAP